VTPISPARPKGPSIIPKEARRKPKNGSFDATEPTSPKVSCAGQIKNKKKKKKKKKILIEKENKKPLTLNKYKRPDIKEQVEEVFELRVAKTVPNLGKMTKFSSSRETALKGFDWSRATILDQSNYNHVINNNLYGECNDDDKKGKESLDEDEEVLNSKIKVYLWKRRNVIPPKPLEM
jgi:hypothetical protein